MTDAAGVLQDFDASCLGPMTTANAKAAEACIFKNAPNRFLQLRNEVQQQLLVSRDMPCLPVGLSARKCAMLMQAALIQLIAEPYGECQIAVHPGSA
jgi:hypothetical protein